MNEAYTDLRRRCEIKLWKKHASGAIGYWRIWAADQPFIRFAYSVTGSGEEAVNSDIVELNNSGRSWEEQARLEIESRAKRKMQRGYKASPTLAQVEKGLNQIGLPMPMLALRIEKAKVGGGHKFVQPKLNGHRCLIAKSGGKMLAYSRLGTQITTVDHLLKTMERVMPNDTVMDGELYVHGWKLQTISSAIKRAQDSTALLNFICYDIVDGAPYSERLEMLKEIIKPAWQIDTRINGCSTTEVETVEQAWGMFVNYKTQKYEGGILRLDGSGYKPGVRSNALLKLKTEIDDEFRIVNVRLEHENYPVMTLSTREDVLFDCTAPGTLPEKMDFYAHRAEHIGKMMTCEYAELTADGRPFHCVALQIKEEV